MRKHRNYYIACMEMPSLCAVIRGLFDMGMTWRGSVMCGLFCLCAVVKDACSLYGRNISPHSKFTAIWQTCMVMA